MPRKAFKYRLYPNKEQEQTLFWTLTRCRELYNAALTERRDAYNFHVRQHPNYYDKATRQQLTKELTVNYPEQKGTLPQIKAELREEYQDIHSQVLQDVLLRLERAFQNFFRRVREGAGEPGYPRFKGRHRYDSFTYPQGGFSVDVQEKRATLTLSKIGTIKVKLHRKLEGKMKTCTVKHEAGQWYVVFSCEVAPPEPLPALDSEVGIDLGITHFAALSDGTFIESPRYLRQAEKKLAKRHQALSRKKRGSHRRDKARQLVAKAHRKIKNQRRDFHQKHSTQLVKQYQTIVFEELEIQNLTKHAKPKQDEQGTYLPNGASAKSGLTKSILDAGWGQFQQMCVTKAACAGHTVLKVNPRYTSQVCSQCGTVRKKSLEERWHSCECGCSLDRDTNAALNILRLGSSQRGDAPRVEAPCL